MGRSGTLIHGITKPTYSFLTNRKFISSIGNSTTMCSTAPKTTSVGVGFSYADHGETVETTEDAARNVHAFIAIFFETFDQFKGRPLHLAGESYGVRDRCSVAAQAETVDGALIGTVPARLRRRDLGPKSVRRGRGPSRHQPPECPHRERHHGHLDVSARFFAPSLLLDRHPRDRIRLYPGRYEIECGTAALDVPFQFISSCVRMKKAVSSVAYPEADKLKYGSGLTAFSSGVDSFRDARKLWMTIACSRSTR